jgi:hypothetical protein
MPGSLKVGGNNRATWKKDGQSTGIKQIMTTVQKRPLLFMECLDTEIIGDYVCVFIR